MSCVRHTRHTFQVLTKRTKRADRMREYFSHHTAPANAWLGVTEEDRRHGFPRIEALRDIDAPIRFISAEPLLEDLKGLDLKKNGRLYRGRIWDEAPTKRDSMRNPVAYPVQTALDFTQERTL